MAFVLDNSVVVAWFIAAQANDYTRRMDHRAEREQPVVPALWEVELAARRGLPLATRDANLVRAARSAGVTLA